MNEFVGKLLEFSTGECLYKVLWNAVDGHDIRQVDFGRSGARQFDFCLFGSFFKTLESHRVLTEVDAFFFLEFVGEPVDDDVVEVVAAEVCVSVGRFYFEDAVAEFED